MTKRFEWDSALDKVYDYDKPCAGTFTSYHEWEIVDLLNDQHEEKEQLKQENKELEEENEQLKSDAVYWGQNAEARLKEIDKLRKEKEQLKDTLAFRSNQLALMEELIDDLGTDEMCREMEDILNG